MLVVKDNNNIMDRIFIIYGKRSDIEYIDKEKDKAGLFDSIEISYPNVKFDKTVLLIKNTDRRLKGVIDRLQYRNGEGVKGDKVTISNEDRVLIYDGRVKDATLYGLSSSKIFNGRLDIISESDFSMMLIGLGFFDLA